MATVHAGHGSIFGPNGITWLKCGDEYLLQRLRIFASKPVDLPGEWKIPHNINYTCAFPALYMSNCLLWWRKVEHYAIMKDNFHLDKSYCTYMALNRIVGNSKHCAQPYIRIAGIVCFSALSPSHSTPTQAAGQINPLWSPWVISIIPLDLSPASAI